MPTCPDLLATNILESSSIQTPTQLFFSCVTQCICVWVNLENPSNGVFLQKLFGSLNLKNIFSAAVLSLSLWACEVRWSLLQKGGIRQRELCSQPPPTLPATPPTSWIQATDLSHVGPAQACDVVPGSPACDQKTVESQPSATAAYCSCICWESRIISNSVFSLK